MWRDREEAKQNTRTYNKDFQGKTENKKNTEAKMTKRTQNIEICGTGKHKLEL